MTTTSPVSIFIFIRPSVESTPSTILPRSGVATVEKSIFVSFSLLIYRLFFYVSIIYPAGGYADTIMPIAPPSMYVDLCMLYAVDAPNELVIVSTKGVSNGTASMVDASVKWVAVPKAAG